MLLGILFQKDLITELPSYRHTWALADHYALAQRFTENGMNFFKPETYVLNHQFPGEMRIPATESLTAVDFPIHNFVPAIFMKILGTDAPIIFRGYILLYSFLGLFFLFKLVLFITGDHYKALFTLIFAATSPVFVYYQAAFLPTIPALANTIIGFYFYSKYSKDQRHNHFIFSLIFLTLAALSRTTFVIPLIAILCNEFLKVIAKKTEFKNKILPVTMAISLVTGYFIYNGYLRQTYGSIFLNDLMPAKSWERFVKVWHVVQERWITEYFSVYHYILLGFVCLGFIYFKFLHKKFIISKISNLNRTTAIYLLGCILFAIAMWLQFEHHEYYFLDTFYLPFILVLIILLKPIRLASYPWLKPIMIVLFSIPLITQAVNSQSKKMIVEDWNRPTKTVINFKNSDQFLTASGISKNAKILVSGTQAPNAAFIQMRRKGFAIIYPNSEWLSQALSWDYDYVVAEKSTFKNDFIAHYPNFLNEFKTIAHNDKLLLFQKE